MLRRIEGLVLADDAGCFLKVKRIFALCWTLLHLRPNPNLQTGCEYMNINKHVCFDPEGPIYGRADCLLETRRAVGMQIALCENRSVSACLHTATMTRWITSWLYRTSRRKQKKKMNHGSDGDLFSRWILRLFISERVTLTSMWDLICIHRCFSFTSEKQHRSPCWSSNSDVVLHESRDFSRSLIWWFQTHRNPKSSTVRFFHWKQFCGWFISN